MTSCAARDPAGQQRGIDRHGALDQGQADRAELVVPRRRTGEADDCAAGFRRAELDRVTVGGQPVHAAVQVQEHQPPRRVAEVVHPGHRLLPAVAALVQVHRGLDPADLVRDGPVIGIQAEPGHLGGDPQRLERPHARHARRPRRTSSAATSGSSSRATIRSMIRTGPAACRACHPVELRGDIARRGPGHGQHGVVLADVGDLDPQHEPHGFQELGQGRGGARLHVHPHRGRRRRSA